MHKGCYEQAKIFSAELLKLAVKKANDISLSFSFCVWYVSHWQKKKYEHIFKNSTCSSL